MYIKIILLVFFAGLQIEAGEKNLTPIEHQYIHHYNQKPSLKAKEVRRMHRLHQIDEKEVAKITQNATGEAPQSLKLNHQGLLLFFFVKTASYHLLIDAIDGKILKKAKYE